jgi:TrmH family RNA methyltransferase
LLTKAELQRLRSLRDKKHREELGLFVVEGAKVVGELLAAGLPFSELYATAAWPAPAGAAVTRVSADEMARASHFPTPSEVLAVGPIRREPLAGEDLSRGLTLALDGVQDPGNVGTLLRIVDWFAFDRVVLSPDCADLFHQKVINASMGSFARVRTHTSDLGAALTELRASSPATPILGCDLGGQDIHTLAPLPAAVVVIGSEGRGLSPAVRQSVTHYVTIPRRGGAESLNAAVAAGIICAQLRRGG